MSEFSWVTLATNDSYSLGALVLAHSLKRVGTKYQLVVMVTPGVTQSMREKLAAVFNLVFEVNILDSKDERNLLLLQRPELGITFTKLHCWRLTQFKKCVFLDADTLVLQNCDELFERDEFSAAPDVGWPDCFNSGVFVYAPSDETFNSLLTFALERGSFDGGDQGLLNLYFSDWAHKDISKHLPFIYNMCSTACYSYLPAFKQFGENVKIVHFIGNSKPWLQYFNSETLQVTPTPGFNHLQMIFDHWWNLFCANVHSNLATSMGGLAGAFAQMTLREPKSASQGALEEHLRRQGWEAGRIDYLGQDSFDNVWKKICETISAAPVKEPSPPKQLPVKQPSPPKQIAEQPAKQPSPPKEQPAKESSPPKQLEVQPSAPAAALETTPAPVVSTPEPAPAPACTAPAASAPETSTPVVAPTLETQVAPVPEIPTTSASETPVTSTPEAPAAPALTPETPAPETLAPEIATPTPAPETPAAPAPITPTPETKAALETVSPVEPIPVPATTVIATEPTAPVAAATPAAEFAVITPTPTPEAAIVPEPVVAAAAPELIAAAPTAAAALEPEVKAVIPEPVTAVSAAAPEPVAATPEQITAAPAAAPVAATPEPVAATPEQITAAPAASPETAPATTESSKPKGKKSKHEEQKPKETTPAAATEETKPASEVAPPAITETPATPQTPDATKGELKAAQLKPAEGQSSETPVPPPRKSGKNGGATTKKSSKKK